jgi:hypothetical protein
MSFFFWRIATGLRILLKIVLIVKFKDLWIRKAFILKVHSKIVLYFLVFY